MDYINPYRHQEMRFFPWTHVLIVSSWRCEAVIWPISGQVIGACWPAADGWAPQRSESRPSGILGCVLDLQLRKKWQGFIPSITLLAHHMHLIVKWENYRCWNKMALDIIHFAFFDFHVINLKEWFSDWRVAFHYVSIKLDTICRYLNAFNIWPPYTVLRRSQQWLEVAKVFRISLTNTIFINQNKKNYDLK